MATLLHSTVTVPQRRGTVFTREIQSGRADGCPRWTPRDFPDWCRIAHPQPGDVHLIPWPTDYDPPAFPDKPGEHSEIVRKTWQAWGRLWDAIADPLGVDADHETVGELFTLYGRLRRLGVVFAPAFCDQMAEWARLGLDVDVDWDADHGV